MEQYLHSIVLLQAAFAVVFYFLNREQPLRFARLFAWGSAIESFRAAVLLPVVHNLVIGVGQWYCIADVLCFFATWCVFAGCADLARVRLPSWLASAYFWISIPLVVINRYGLPPLLQAGWGLPLERGSFYAVFSNLIFMFLPVAAAHLTIMVWLFRIWKTRRLPGALVSALFSVPFVLLALAVPIQVYFSVYPDWVTFVWSVRVLGFFTGLVMLVISQQQSALRASEAGLAAAQSLAKLGHWELDLSTGAGKWSAEMFRLFGRDPSLGGMNLEEFLEIVHPDDRQLMGRTGSLAMTGTQSHAVEFRIIRSDGTICWMAAQSDSVRDATGKLVHVAGTMQDITEHKLAELRVQHANRMYAVLSDINQLIVREKDSNAMLIQACRIAVEKGRFRMAWIGLTDAPAGRQQIVAHAGATDDTLKIIQSLLGDEERAGDCVFTLRALQTGERAVCNDIEHDPRTAVWRDAALQRDYRSMASVPLKAAEKKIGTFNLYAGETDFFDDEELQLLDELAADLSLALEIHRREAESQLAEIALRESERNYREIFNATADAILIHDAVTGRVLHVNEATLRMFGLSSESEVIGRMVSDLSADEPPFTLAEAQANIRRAFETGPQVFEWWARKKTGERFWVEVSLRSSSLGGKGRILAVVRDITGRKRIEQTLQMFQYSIGQASDAVFWLTRDAGFSYVNEQACRSLGYTREELMLLHLWDIDPAFPREQWGVEWEEYQKGQRGGSQNLESIHRRKDGSTFPVEVVSNHLWFGDQELHVAVVRDITERRRAAEAHTLLATAVEQAAEAVVITKADGAVVYVNPAFRKITGYELHEAIGQNPRILRSGKHDEAFYQRLWETVARGEVWSGHIINKKKDGSLYEEEMTISPVRDSAGKIVNYVAVKRDVTREVALESQFRQAQKMEAVGMLAGGVAHDFNNILAIIQMQSEMLKSDAGLNPEQAEFAGEITKAAQRAANLTRQLLLFSRRQAMQPRDIDLNEVVANMTKMLQRILGEDVRMQFNYAPHPLILNADAGMLDQVLLNLVVNSRDAMPKGGKLVIETAAVELDEPAAAKLAQSRPGSFACVSVNDTGFGIPKDVLPRIFEPFFTTKGVGKGSGLGLATVFGIVEQHQGWISVESEIGRGTTFRVYLPSLGKEAVQRFAAPKLATMSGGNETILVVEDDPSLRILVRNILTRLGYRVLEAPTGVGALDVWKENREEIRLLFTDLVMPDGMTGRELAQRLVQENPRLKVIYTSGYSAEIAGAEFPLEPGVNFLPKPYEIYKLSKAVRASLDEA